MAGTYSWTSTPSDRRGATCCLTRNRAEATWRPDVRAATSIIDRSRPYRHPSRLTEQTQQSGDGKEHEVTEAGLLREVDERLHQPRREATIAQTIAEAAHEVPQHPLVKDPVHAPPGPAEQAAQGLRGEMVEMVGEVQRVPRVLEHAELEGSRIRHGGDQPAASPRPAVELAQAEDRVVQVLQRHPGHDQIVRGRGRGRGLEGTRVDGVAERARGGGGLGRELDP